MNFRRLWIMILATTSVSSMEATAAQPVRVMSFNIRYITPGDTGNRTWLARRDQVGTVIREDNPDVVGLQEAFRTMLDDIAMRVPGYEEVGVGREDGKTRGEYAAILVRKDRMSVMDSGNFWLSDTPEVPGSATWQNRVTRICTWAKLLDRANNSELYVYNCHLDHESQEAREKGLALIMAHATATQSRGPFILTGDFNADEDNTALTRLKEHPLAPVDVWRSANREVPLTESGTFHEFAGEKSGGKIDYIFVSPPVRVIESSIIHRNEDGIYPSDHFPLRATVEFPLPSTPAAPDLEPQIPGTTR